MIEKKSKNFIKANAKDKEEIVQLEAKFKEMILSLWVWEIKLILKNYIS